MLGYVNKRVFRRKLEVLEGITAEDIAYTLRREDVVSNLISIHQKKYIGSLSAYFGAVSAVCGAEEAIMAHFLGGEYHCFQLGDGIVIKYKTAINV